MVEAKATAASGASIMAKIAADAVDAVRARQKAHFAQYGEQKKDAKSGELIGSVFDTESAIREEVGRRVANAGDLAAIRDALMADVAAKLGD